MTMNERAIAAYDKPLTREYYPSIFEKADYILKQVVYKCV
ncbi:hypothetical protein NUACC26_003780 [Scytonema sp. NUACC26]